MMETPKTRQEARSLGTLRYFTGKPCINGHLAERWTADGSCYDCAKEKAKKWKRKNRSRMVEYNREYTDKNREKYRAYWRKAVKDNPLKFRASNARRRARLRNAEGFVSKEFVAKLLQLQRSKCASCLKSIAKSFHIDHIVPLKLGGQHSENNIQLLCRCCNLKKGAKHPQVWAKENGRLI